MLEPHAFAPTTPLHGHEEPPVGRPVHPREPVAGPGEALEARDLADQAATPPGARDAAGVGVGLSNATAAACAGIMRETHSRPRSVR